MNDEIVLKWIKERLADIVKNCDLKDEYNKKVYDILIYIKEVFENNNTEKDDFLIMIMCYYHKGLLYKILSDDAKSNDYVKFEELKKLCKEFKESKIDNEDIDIEDTTRIFLARKLEV